MRKLTASADTALKKEAGQWETMKRLLPYLWPKGRADLKTRVVAAMLLLVLSKVVTVLTPYAFKWATDALTTLDQPAIAGVAAAVFMVLAYGLGRVFMVVFAQLRDAVFSKVGQRTVREMSSRTFRHLHNLSLKYHLTRRTGGLSRIISRGINGVDSVLRFALFNTLPTALEIVSGLRAARLVLRLALCAHRGADGDCLYLVHLCRHRMAHRPFAAP